MDEFNFMHACILQDVLETSVLLSVINAQEQDVRDEYLIFLCQLSNHRVYCIGKGGPLRFFMFP